MISSIDESKKYSTVVRIQPTEKAVLIGVNVKIPRIILSLLYS